MNAALIADLSRLRRLAPDCATEWDSVNTAHLNVLLEGTRRATEMAVVLMKPHLKKPFFWRRPGEAFEVHCGRRGTIILEDVATLSSDEQVKLRSWLDESRPPVQIVATTTSPLYPLVESGRFDGGLYYRLNVMLLRVKAAPVKPAKVYSLNNEALEHRRAL